MTGLRRRGLALVLALAAATLLAALSSRSLLDASSATGTVGVTGSRLSGRPAAAMAPVDTDSRAHGSGSESVAPGVALVVPGSMTMALPSGAGEGPGVPGDGAASSSEGGAIMNLAHKPGQVDAAPDSAASAAAPRVAIVTVFIGDRGYKHRKIAASQACYAKRHGYDYIEVLEPLFDSSELLQPHWNKVAALQKYLPQYDYVLWVDYDCVFLDINRPLSQYIRKLKNGFSMIAPQEHPKNRKFSNFAFLLANTPSATLFLDIWWSFRHTKSANTNFDQGAMRPAMLKWIAHYEGILERSPTLYTHFCENEGPATLANCFEFYLSKMGYGGGHLNQFSENFINMPPIWFTVLDFAKNESGLALQTSHKTSEGPCAKRPGCVQKAFIVHTTGSLDRLFTKLFFHYYPDAYMSSCDFTKIESFRSGTSGWDVGATMTPDTFLSLHPDVFTGPEH